MSNPNCLQLELIDFCDLNHRMRHFRFKLGSNKSFSYKAGQFITLHIPRKEDGKIIKRNFSIANPPSSDNDAILEFAASFVQNGLASTMLWNLQPGDLVEASGPFGIFTLKLDAGIDRVILVATGTGVTPYRSMLQELEGLLQREELREVLLLLGVRDKTETLYHEEFFTFAERNPNFKFFPCYSREAAAEYKYVQDVLKIIEINHLDVAYLCGNPNMVDEALALLESLGLARTRIRREKYISAK